MKFCGRLAARACASALLLMGFPSPAKAIGPGATSRFVPLTPARLMDTRDNLGNVPLGKPGRDATVTTQVTGRFGIPAGAVAAVLNVTVTEAAGPGFISVFPAGSARPLVSNVNTEYAGQTIPNLVTVPLGIGGQVSFYAQSGAHLIADVFGYYESAATATGGRLARPARRC